MARLFDQRPTTSECPRAPVRAIVTALLAACLIACGTHEAPAARPGPVAKSAPLYTITAVRAIRFPFAGETLAPYVTGDGAGGFLVSWIEKRTPNMNFAALRAGKWFQPRTIAGGKLVINKADFPSIAAGLRGVVFAQWIEKKEEHGTRVRIARSDDGGATWRIPQTPHTDMQSEFGFVSILPTADDALLAVWLDGRKLEGGEEGRGDMELHAATLARDGTLANDVVLDPRVCDCCQTSMVLTDGGPVVAYRDRSESEIRDISITRLTTSGWTPPKTLHADGWQIHGCPVNGPRLAAAGANVAGVWFTAAHESPRVNVAFSHDSGETFSQPIRIDEGHPAGHVDAGMLGDGSALVTWIETAGPIATIEARRVQPSGALDPVVHLGRSSSVASIGYPRLAVSNDNVAVAWTQETNGASSVEMAAIQLAK
jgi:hypothetical protein